MMTAEQSLLTVPGKCRIIMGKKMLAVCGFIAGSDTIP
jgi:hypothetical protein